MIDRVEVKTPTPELLVLTITLLTSHLMTTAFGDGCALRLVWACTCQHPGTTCLV